MPCSGKSTVGPILAQKLGWDFFDTDQYLREKHKLNFAEAVENGDFHKYELAALKASESERPCVVATGGRTYLDPTNKEYINQHGQTIFIWVSLWRLVFRLNAAEIKKRSFLKWPLSLPLLYWQRNNAYRQDSRIVDGNADIKTVVNDIIFLANR